MSLGRPAVFFSTLIWALAAISCGGGAPPQAELDLHTTSGEVMGTTYSVKVVAESLSSEAQETLATEVRRSLDAVDRWMSTYRDDSELSRLNRAAAEAVELSAETLGLLRRSQEISRWTGGAFDITVGPLVNAYGFGPGADPDRVPSAAELADLEERVGWEKLEVRVGEGTARKAHPELYCDLSAIAKGFAVDRVAEALGRLGYRRFMVEVGGEVRTAGRKADGSAWRIGVERPEPGRRALQRVVPLVGQAMATSGDYRNFREVDGQRVTHIFDPRSGRTIHHRLASATVIHDDCATADALATSLMVMGPDEAQSFAEAEGLAVLLLLRDEGEGFTEWRSSAFDSLLADGASREAA